MSRGKVYISGPISGVADGNKKAFSDMERYWRVLGFEAVNPHVICAHIPDGSPWEHYMRVCIRELADCDYMVMLPNWRKSRGARIENAMAKHLGIIIDCHCYQRTITK